jgi:molecular chaperone HscB
VEALAAEVAAERRSATERLASLIDVEQRLDAAAQQVRALMFIERFADDVDRRLDALGQ